MASDLPLADRLKIAYYDAEACSLAIRGKKLPFALRLPVTRHCVVHGIHFHAGFATELLGLHGYAEFTRALNARRIMSNVIPDMEAAEEFPYCIWHPDLATEATYSKLAHRYPQMRYQVGRACAIAGYLSLYRDLRLLPDVFIAEEARDSQTNGTTIFQEIMAQPTKYAVMDDYTRSVNSNNPRPGACLNGDTAVRSLLEVKQCHCELTRDTTLNNLFAPAHDETHYFNITEDWAMDCYDSQPPDNNVAEPLLYSPLPTNLLPINEDLLILIAAYYGNIDRYDRLRHPKMIPAEYSCILEVTRPFMQEIRRAINARFIMNNDVSRLIEEMDEGDLPYLIWYPSWANSSTYEELAQRKPSMKAQAGRACIVADYQDSYDKIQVKPDYFLLGETRASHRTYYVEDLRRRASELQLDITTPRDGENWKELLARRYPPDHRSTILPARLSLDWVGYHQDGRYNGLEADISSIELFVSTPEEMRPSGENSAITDLQTLYSKTPRVNACAGRGGISRSKGRGRGSSSSAG